MDFYAILFKYLTYWPWFVGCIVICLSGTYVYLRYQAPVYEVQSAVLIKEQDSKQSSNSPTITAIQDMGMMSLSNNFDNELQILKSQTLVRKVVEDLGLYISHSIYRPFSYNLPLYNKTPIKVYMNPEEAKLLKKDIVLRMEYVPNVPLHVTLTYTYQGKEIEKELNCENFPAILPTEVGVITLSPDTTFHSEDKIKLIAQITNPNEAAAWYKACMSVEPTSKTTTIAQINVQNTVKQRGIDLIYKLVDIYNREANDEKNEVAQKTAEFIEERIAIIDKELGSTENHLANFKQRSRLTNLTNDTQMALQETSKYDQELTENATQMNLMQDLASYIVNPENTEEVIPANVGIQDPNLANVINQYNTLIVERKRLLRTSSENNPAVINLNSGIEAMRTTVQTSVEGVLRGLKLEAKNLQREARKYEGRINNAPTQEKEYLSIARQQEIKANLYTMLLQKREENAITLASTASNGRIIETPTAKTKPVSPSTKSDLIAALLAGIAIPIGVIYLGEKLKYKIENREDAEQITDVPVIAELPKGEISQSIKGAIMIHENKNEWMEEAFRSLRTNLLFMMKPEEKVIMITSSQPSEGKSFVAGNLAVSLAYLGKKVLIIGLDIRKSGMERVFGINNHTQGITNYLNRPDETDLDKLVISSEIHDNLDILPRGNVPPNPTELVARKALETAIKNFKIKYDFVVLDTAPIAMITDTNIISRVADIGVYVCRADFTPKAAFQHINIWKEGTDMKLAVVVNSLDLKKRKNRIHMNYGYKYGYGRHYGYGYGYKE